MLQVYTGCVYRLCQCQWRTSCTAACISSIVLGSSCSHSTTWTCHTTNTLSDTHILTHTRAHTHIHQYMHGSTPLLVHRYTHTHTHKHTYTSHLWSPPLQHIRHLISKARPQVQTSDVQRTHDLLYLESEGDTHTHTHATHVCAHTQTLPIRNKLAGPETTHTRAYTTHRASVHTHTLLNPPAKAVGCSLSARTYPRVLPERYRRTAKASPLLSVTLCALRMIRPVTVHDTQHKDNTGQARLYLRVLPQSAMLRMCVYLRNTRVAAVRRVSRCMQGKSHCLPAICCGVALFVSMSTTRIRGVITRQEPAALYSSTRSKEGTCV